jgi:hypothetical protein
MGERMKQYQDPAEIAPPQKSAREYRIYPALIERCAELEPVSTAVAHPCDESSLTAAIEAAEADLIRPVLVAPENKIRSVAEQFGLDIRPKIPSTIDAAALCKMAERGQITGGLLDGPLAFDNAISKEAAGNVTVPATKADVSFSDVLGQSVDGRLGVGVSSLYARLSPENDVEGISVDATRVMVRPAAALHRGAGGRY